MPRPTSHLAQQQYILRILGCLAGTLLALIVLVRSWPAPGSDAGPVFYNDRATDAIQVTEILPTRQSLERRPPPPAPLPPVVVPNDVIVEQTIRFSDSALPIEDPGDDAMRRTGTSEEAAVAARPDVNARLLRYVEPEYTRSARKHEIRAQVVVAVQIDAQGRVKAVQIVDRQLLNKTGQSANPVDHLGYGLEEAALTAVRQWLYRPAQANGRAVPTRTTHTLRFGI